MIPVVLKRVKKLLKWDMINQHNAIYVINHTHRRRKTDTDCRHIRTYMTHRIKDSHPSRDWATGGVDVKRNILDRSSVVNIDTLISACNLPSLDPQHLTKEAALRLSYSCHRLQHLRGEWYAAWLTTANVSRSNIRSPWRRLKVTRNIDCRVSCAHSSTKFTNLGHELASNTLKALYHNRRRALALLITNRNPDSQVLYYHLVE